MNRYHGFTLLEMILTSAIAAMLMAAVLGLCTSMVTGSQVMDRQMTASNLLQPWQQQAIALFQWDITQAREIQVQENQISLIGYSGIDPVTLEATHRPVQVTYEILFAADPADRSKEQGDRQGGKHGGAGGWLIRQQMFLDIPATQANPPSVQLLAGPVGGLSLYPLTPPSAQELTLADQPTATANIRWGQAKFQWSLFQKNPPMERRSTNPHGSIRAVRIVVAPPTPGDNRSHSTAALIDQIISLPSISQEGGRP